jgi:hypothetical protein
VLVNFTVRWIDKLRLLADGDVTDEVATIPVGARSWLIVSEMPASTEFESSTGQVSKTLMNQRNFVAGLPGHVSNPVRGTAAGFPVPA